MARQISRLRPKLHIGLAISLALIVSYCSAADNTVDVDKTVSPGGWINLTGPNPPNKVTYMYLWTVQIGGVELTNLKNSTSSNVVKTFSTLNFYAPNFGNDTILTIGLNVAAKKTGGSSLEDCSSNAVAKTVLVRARLHTNGGST